MLHEQRHQEDAEDSEITDAIRDIHELIPPPQPSSSRGRWREAWEAGSNRSSTPSLGSEFESLPTMSREFNAMVAAGNTLHISDGSNGGNGGNDGGGNLNLARIGEEELEETNPLAIVPDSNPIPSPRRRRAVAEGGGVDEEVEVHRVKKDEVASKISAWQTEEIAKVNNKLKREEVVINGWESEQVEKAAAWLKKVERKLEEKRARAVEKMQNDIAKARRKAEEKRASAEAKRGTKVAKVLELANLMKAVGRAPSKRSFF